MVLDESVLRRGELIQLTLRELYRRRGYQPYRMNKFEEYDLYADNRDFLASGGVLTFTDENGRLMALRPDVTLSIIKNSRDEPDSLQRVFYNESVYRPDKHTHEFCEIMQSGVECFGAVDAATVCDVVCLAAESLQQVSNRGVLAVSCPDILSGLADRMGLPAEERRSLLKAAGERNLHEVDSLCPAGPEKDALISLLSVYAPVGEAALLLDNALRGLPEVGFGPFRHLLDELADSPFSSMMYVDFSVTGDMNYYNGIVFKGYVDSMPEAVLSGGRYDKLMRKMGRVSGAIGFAVYTGALERQEASAPENDGYVNVALPKGRLGERVYEMFAKAGYECPSILEANRRLMFENAENRVRYFWVKPSDVAIYVERGAADIGVVGKDILLETTPDIYELLDLNTGICRMAAAAPEGFRDNHIGTLRVATKYTRITRDYYRSQGRDIDIIHLNGSIELAPLLGLADVIVDIVETGTTLRENHLQVIDEIVPISARLISNKSSYNFKNKSIRAIAEQLKNIREEKK